jgi:hypothetical protein
MANIQIRNGQIKDATIQPGKIDLTATFDYSSGTITVATPTADAQAATKAYVDGLVADGFQAGNGITINTGTSPDTISVKVAADGALSFIGSGTDELAVKVKSESGGSITRDADGLYIADSAISSAKLAGSIANAKLANSTISGKALGASLDALSDGNGIADFTYDGSGVAAIAIDLDGSTLAVSANGVKVADLGVDTGQLAARAVQAAKLDLQNNLDKFTGDNTATFFDLSSALLADFIVCDVYKNGLYMDQVASSPANQDEFTVSATGGTGGVGRITFGAAPSTADVIRVKFISDT